MFGFFKLLEVRCKIESVVGVYLKKLLAKIVNLIFKYILLSYFVKCGWRCSKDVDRKKIQKLYFVS